MHFQSQILTLGAILITNLNSKKNLDLILRGGWGSLSRGVIMIARTMLGGFGRLLFQTSWVFVNQLCGSEETLSLGRIRPRSSKRYDGRGPTKSMSNCFHIQAVHFHALLETHVIEVSRPPSHGERMCMCHHAPIPQPLGNCAPMPFLCPPTPLPTVSQCFTFA